MELIKLAKLITDKIDDLEKLGKLLHEYSIKKANTISDYDKAMAITILKIRNAGDTFVFEGEKIVNLPASVMEKVAKGLCYKERLAMELADAEYGALTTKIRATEAILNGYQSINRTQYEMETRKQ
jgi:hypothetical protein